MRLAVFVWVVCAIGAVGCESPDGEAACFAAGGECRVGTCAGTATLSPDCNGGTCCAPCPEGTVASQGALACVAGDGGGADATAE